MQQLCEASDGHSQHRVRQASAAGDVSQARAALVEGAVTESVRGAYQLARLGSCGADWRPSRSVRQPTDSQRAQAHNPTYVRQQFPMNISSQEAVSLLEAWKNAGITLRVHIAGKELQATVGAITGTVIRLITDSGDLDVDVHGADFNGDKGKGSSNAGGYLVCEFRNDDRYSFYVSRSSDTRP